MIAITFSLIFLRKKEDFDSAYSELIMRQQQKTAELTTKIQKKIDQMNRLADEQRAKTKDTVKRYFIIKQNKKSIHLSKKFYHEKHLTDQDLYRQEIIKQGLIKDQRSASRERKRKNNIEKSETKSFKVEFVNDGSTKSGKKLVKPLNQTTREDFLSEPDLYQRLNLSGASPNNFLEFVSANATPVKVEKGFHQSTKSGPQIGSARLISFKPSSPEKEMPPQPYILVKKKIVKINIFK